MKNMDFLTVLIKPTSSKCNMLCSYCFYRDIAKNRDVGFKGFMTTDTARTVIDKVFDYCNQDTVVNFSFQGGEPLLRGVNFYKDFIEYCNSKKSIKTEYSIQTNGLLINKEWAALFKENDFLVGISLDGVKEIHDSLRIDVNHEKTFTKIMNSIELLKKNDIRFNILTVLSKQLSRHPKELFDFYLEKNFRYIQFIPCMVDLKNSSDDYTITPIELFDFYKVLFELWFNELKKGNYISFNYFDNLVNLFAGFTPNQCGFLGKCSLQLIVESNGDIYPCDFYATDEYRLGNININTLKELCSCKEVTDFIHSPRKLSEECGSCDFFNLCYGQCKRLSECYYNDDFCALKEFMKLNKDNILEAISILRGV